MSTNTTEYMTLKEVSSWIRLSHSKIYALTSKNNIPYIKIGGKLLFDKEKIQNWIDTQSSK